MSRSLLVFLSLACACTSAASATPPARAPWLRYEDVGVPRGAHAPRASATHPLPTRPLGFRDAKARLDHDVYDTDAARHEIYCGCAYAVDRVIDPSACGYTPPTQSAVRASRMEWDHAVPFSRFGRLFPCYREPPGRDSHREHCVAVDDDARAMEGDMHNLLPSLGQINALREDFELAELEGETHVGGCDFERDTHLRVAEPRPEARGDLARAYLYMHVTYRLPLTDAERTRYLTWHRADPPTEWERTRNARIRAIQGNDNPFVTDPARAP